ncbi:MMPL family transporter [Paenibacillus sp. GCM10027626]|uniref:MMPL family transporter n=1 Tax=Paenibacillus sp. GCM10027626 TaxID=3273411 RepID=UPI0036337130
MLLNGVKRLARSVSSNKGSWAVITIWMIIIVLLQTSMPWLAPRVDNMQSQFNASLPSRTTEQLLKKHYPTDEQPPVLLVWQRQSGLTKKDYAEIDLLSQTLYEKPIYNQKHVGGLYDDMRGSINGRIFVQPLYLKKGILPADIKISLRELASVIGEQFIQNPLNVSVNNKEELSVRISGPAPIIVEESERTSPDLLLLLAVFSFIVIIQLLVYRSPVWAAAPITAIVAAYLALTPLLAEMFARGWISYQERFSAIVLMVLAVSVIDHLFFIFSSYRIHRKEQGTILHAIGKIVRQSSFIFAAFGLIVTLITFLLLIAQYGPIERFYSWAHAAALLIALASAALLPALKNVLGFEHPAIERSVDDERLPLTKTWPAFINMMLVLAIGAGVTLQMKYTFDTLSTYSANSPSPSREGMILLAGHMDLGKLAPIQLLVNRQMNQAEAENLRHSLQWLPSITLVTHPMRSKINPDMFWYKIRLAGNPYSLMAMENLTDIRSVIKKYLAPDMTAASLNAASKNFWLAGPTAAQYDRYSASKRASIVLIPVILVVFILMLLLFFRAIRNFIGYR